MLCYCIFQRIHVSREAINRFVCRNCLIKPLCSISDTGDCHGYCRFPAFLWQPHQKQETEPPFGWFASSSSSSPDELRGGGLPDVVAERRWFERMVYNSPDAAAGGAGSAMWDSRRQITARATEIWTERRVQTPCASSATGGGQQPPAGRMACYRRESASNVSCLAEEPSGKYRVLVTEADG